MRATASSATPIPAALPSGRAELALVLGGKTAEWASLVLLLTLVPRLLGPADFGTFGLALSIVTLGSAAAAVGGPATIARLAGGEPAERRAAVARALAVRAARWRGGWAVAVALVALALVLADPARFAPAVVVLVVLALVLDIAATLAFQVALALGRTRAWSFRYGVQNTLLVALAVALHSPLGREGALAAIPISVGLVLAAGLASVGRPLRAAGAGAAVPEVATRFALLQGVAGTLFHVTHRGGVVAVALLAGSAVETGYATLAVGVATALIYVPWQLFTIALPRLAAGAPARAERELHRLAWRSLLAVGPLAVAVAALAGPLLPTLVDAEFAGAQAALATAAAAGPLAVLTGWAGTVAALELRLAERAWMAAAGAAAFVVALPLAAAYGSVGAALALLAGTAAGAAVAVVRLPAVRDAALVAACTGFSGAALLAGVLA